jgi:DNA-binding XRE family transcriptional regulator
MRRAREALGKTQEQMSEVVGISPQRWSQIETGRERANVPTYMKIAAAFGITLNDLFYDEADMIRKTPPRGWEELLRGLDEHEQAILTGSVMGIKVAIQRSRKPR